MIRQRSLPVVSQVVSHCEVSSSNVSNSEADNSRYVNVPTSNTDVNRYVNVPVRSPGQRRSMARAKSEDIQARLAVYSNSKVNVLYSGLTPRD